MKIRRWSRLGKGAAALLVLLPLLTGCWDRQEIEERALVLGIGIDEAMSESASEEERSHIRGKLAPTSGKVRISAQIAVPGRIPLGPGTGGGGSGGGGGRTVWVIDAEGRTVDDAINSLQQKVAPPLFFGHLRIIVVAEEIAKKGMQNLNDFFRRNPDVRRMNWMVICKGNAMDIMKLQPQLERVPSLYLMTTMEQSVKMGRLPNDFLGNFWSSSSAKGKEGFLPYVEKRTAGNIQIAGLAYFKGYNMVGISNSLDTILYMGITGVHTAGGESFTNVPGTSEYIEFNARSRKSTTKVRIEDGKPHVYVNINIEGNILEKSNEEVPITISTINKIQKELEKNSKLAYLDFVRRTQEQGSDIFGFGEYVRATQPKYWKEQIQTKEKWQQVYRDIPVDVTVHIHTRRIGMRAV